MVFASEDSHDLQPYITAEYCGDLLTTPEDVGKLCMLSPIANRAYASCPQAFGLRAVRHFTREHVQVRTGDWVVATKLNEPASVVGRVDEIIEVHAPGKAWLRLLLNRVQQSNAGTVAGAVIKLPESGPYADGLLVDVESVALQELHVQLVSGQYTFTGLY